MSTELKPRTAEANGKLWGSSAEDWSGIQEAMCLPVYVEVLNKLNISKGHTYLDVGCGSGMAANIGWTKGAAVYGVDAASSLIETASKRTPEGNFQIGDMEQLSYSDSKFDIVTGFNSFQYAGNPDAALAEAKRVAKPGASVIIMAWGEPDGMEAATLVAALAPLMPPPPAGAPGPFALSDESTLRAFAKGAGLIPVEVLDVQSPWEYDSLEIAVRGLGSSGVSARAKQHSGPEAVDEAHSRALAPFQQPGGKYKIGATFRCLFTKV